MKGSGVCRLHGGLAPQTIAAARLRLAMASDPAAALLVTQLKNAKLEPAERRAAAVQILDRAGITKDPGAIKGLTINAEGASIAGIQIRFVETQPEPAHQVIDIQPVNGHSNGHG